MTNPCLVSYDYLPESEKEYDRNTSMEAIKTILQLSSMGLIGIDPYGEY